MTPSPIVEVPRASLWQVREVCEEYAYQHWPRMIQPRVLDIGANVGIFALGVLEMLPDARVMSFEPHPETFELLKKNTAGLPIECHNMAVIGWERGSPTDLALHEGKRNRLCCSLFDMGDQDMTTAIPVATFLAAELPPCDVLKVDTEGAELEIIGAYRHLGNVKLLMYEFHGPNEDQKMDEALRIGAVANRAGLVFKEQRASTMHFVRHG